MQRIKFINKNGQPMDMVVKVIKKLSKTIVIRNPEDDSLMYIPRGAVESISEAELPNKVKGAD